ncbi:hypothetical protein DOY81_002916, partial [Sarcophaga bullata]
MKQIKIKKTHIFKCMYLFIKCEYYIPNIMICIVLKKIKEKKNKTTKTNEMI